MFTFYGTNSETFAVCQECGQAWIVQGESVFYGQRIESVSEDADDLDTELCLDIEVPNCCGQVANV